MDFFDRAPRGAALETLQKFGVRTGTPFSSYLRALRVVVASTVEKGGPLAPSEMMAIKLVIIRTAQQYPTLMPTLFPGDLATREKPYASLVSMWTAFSDLKHSTSPAIDGDAYTYVPRASGPITIPTVTVPAASAAGSQRFTRLARPSHTVSNVDHVHSRRDPFRVDYGLWPFDDREYTIVCTVTNQMVNSNLSLWTPLLTDDARRQACIQYSGRCCNCGSSEHSLQWCPAPFTIPSPCSTPSLQRTTRMVPYLRRGKNACAGGVDAALTAAPKVMADDTRPTTVTSNPIAEALLRTNKVIVLDSRTLQTSPQSRLNPLHPRVPMVLV